MALLEILDHRGDWNQTCHTPNSLDALVASFNAGRGVETDVRATSRGELIISHDPTWQQPLPLKDVLLAYARLHQPGILALNVKEAGLAPSLKALLEETSVTRAFFFDMAIPDHVSYLGQGLATLARVSDIEPLLPNWVSRCAGVWLDGFESAMALEPMGSPLVLVSPELHVWGRTCYQDIWHQWREQLRTNDFGAVYLCTDHPREAEAWFKENG